MRDVIQSSSSHRPPRRVRHRRRHDNADRKRLPLRRHPEAVRRLLVRGIRPPQPDRRAVARVDADVDDGEVPGNGVRWRRRYDSDARRLGASRPRPGVLPLRRAVSVRRRRLLDPHVRQAVSSRHL